MMKTGHQTIFEDNPKKEMSECGLKRDVTSMNPSSEERNKLEKSYRDVIRVNEALNRKLVSFQANKKIPVYNWFNFKEGFSSRMVQLFIKDYPKKRGRVLDPFAGSCTTLLSARELGFDSVGIEIMPIGDFVLKSKLAIETIDLNFLAKEVEKIKQLDFGALPADEKNSFRHIKTTEKAFPKETKQKLNGFLSYADRLENSKVKQILRFVCFSVLEKISYTRKDGQFLRWDYRAKKGKPNFDKGKVYSFEEAISGKLDQIVSDLRNMQVFGNNKTNNSKMELKTGSSLEILPELADESFDLIISSPPYCNRYDYTRTYALELAFLGLNEEEVRRLRQSLLTCTVENKEKLEFIRDIYRKNRQMDTFSKAEAAFNSTEALQETLAALWSHKENKKLNNPAVYRMVKNYFYEHSFIIFEMARLLKTGGRIYYVNDNVRYAGETIPVDLILSEFAASAGLKVKNIFKLETGKGNSSQQMGLHGREELRKCVYHWEK